MIPNKRYLLLLSLFSVKPATASKLYSSSGYLLSHTYC